MILEIEHDHKEYMHQQLLSWKRTWKKYIGGQIRVLAIGVLLILLSYANSNPHFFTDDALFAAGVFTLLVPGNYLLAYRRRTKSFIKVREAYSKSCAGTRFIYDLNDEGISYSDFERTNFYKWSLLEGFRVSENICMIEAKYSENAVVFMLSETEIGAQKMQELVAFLKSKIKHYK